MRINQDFTEPYKAISRKPHENTVLNEKESLTPIFPIFPQFSRLGKRFFLEKRNFRFKTSVGIDKEGVRFKI